MYFVCPLSHSLLSFSFQGNSSHSGNFLQTCSFPNYQSLGSEVVGFHEFVRHSGSSTGLSTVKDLAQFGIRHSELFPVVGFIGRRMLVLPVSTVD